MARPTKLTPALQARIVALIEAGNYPAVAARATGVGESTFYRWMTDGRPEFQEFRESVERAEAMSEIQAVEKLYASDSRSVTGFLERRFPSRWRRPIESPPRPEPSMPAVRADSQATITFTSEEIAIASIAYLNRKRRAAGEVLQLSDDGLRRLTVADWGPGNPAPDAPGRE